MVAVSASVVFITACDRAEQSKDPKVRKQQERINEAVVAAEATVNKVIDDASRAYDQIARSAQEAKVDVEREMQDVQQNAEELLAEARKLDDVRQAAYEGSEKVVRAAQTAIEYVKPSARPTPRIRQ